VFVAVYQAFYRADARRRRLIIEPDGDCCTPAGRPVDANNSKTIIIINLRLFGVVVAAKAHTVFARGPANAWANNKAMDKNN